MGSDFFKLRDAVEEVVARFDLGGIDGFEAFEAEGFDIVAREDTAVDDRFFEVVEGDTRFAGMGGEVSGEAAGEGVSRTGGVVDVLEREGGAAEKFGFGAEEEASVLAFLDRDIGGAHFADFLAGFDETGFAGELAGFAVVEDEHVHAADEAGEGVFGDVDPEVHRIRDDEARLADLVENMVLEVGRDVGKEDNRSLTVGFG